MNTQSKHQKTNVALTIDLARVGVARWCAPGSACAFVARLLGLAKLRVAARRAGRVRIDWRTVGQATLGLGAPRKPIRPLPRESGYTQCIGVSGYGNLLRLRPRASSLRLEAPFSRPLKNRVSALQQTSESRLEGGCMHIHTFHQRRDVIFQASIETGSQLWPVARQVRESLPSANPSLKFLPIGVCVREIS